MADTPKCATCREETTYSMDVYIKTQCPVCLEDKDKMCALQCGHLFCDECCERIGLMKKNDINTINSNVITYETSMIDYSILTRLINMNKNIEIRIIELSDTPNTTFITPTPEIPIIIPIPSLPVQREILRVLDDI